MVKHEYWDFTYRITIEHQLATNDIKPLHWLCIEYKEQSRFDRIGPFESMEEVGEYIKTL